jgi:hypothetical protein
MCVACVHHVSDSSNVFDYFFDMKAGAVQCLIAK